MAIEYATITGTFASLAGVADKGVTARIVAKTSNGMLVDADTGAIRWRPVPLKPNSLGQVTVTLPKLPQPGITPSDARYELSFSSNGIVRVEPVEFNLTVDTTWGDLVDVSGSPVSDTLIAQLSAIRDQVVDALELATGDGGRSGLAAWYTALSKRATAPAKVVVLGDSVSEGTGATEWTKRPLYLLQQALRAAHPVDGVPLPGSGYIPARTGFAPNPPVTTGGTPSASTTSGLGLKAISVRSGDYVEYSEWCDRIVVRYLQSDFVAADGIVSIDGVDVITLDGANATFIDGLTWDSGALTPGLHTVRIRGTSAGFYFSFSGVDFYNGDFGKGIHVYDATRFGHDTADYTGVAAPRHWQCVTAIDPDLVVVILGINDQVNLTPTEYLTNIDLILAETDTACTGDHSVLLVVPYKPVRNPAESDTDWETMKNGLYARAVGNVALFDMEAAWPVLAADGSTSAGLMSESTYPLHPSDAGHTYMAQLLAKTLSLKDLPHQVGPKWGVLHADVTNAEAVANTMKNVSGLGFPVTAGRKYRFRFEIPYTAAATTTGSRWSVTGPAGTWRYRSEYSLTATTRTINDGLTAVDTPAASNATSAATGSNIAIVEGFFEPSASGWVTARFASEVTVSAIVAKAGATVEYHEVG